MVVSVLLPFTPVVLSSHVLTYESIVGELTAARDCDDASELEIAALTAESSTASACASAEMAAEALSVVLAAVGQMPVGSGRPWAQW